MDTKEKGSPNRGKQLGGRSLRGRAFWLLTRGPRAVAFYIAGQGSPRVLGGWRAPNLLAALSKSAGSRGSLGLLGQSRAQCFRRTAAGMPETNDLAAAEVGAAHSPKSPGTQVTSSNFRQNRHQCSHHASNHEPHCTRSFRAAQPPGERDYGIQERRF